MAKDMKLIMEGWREKFLTEITWQSLSDCDTNEIKISHMFFAYADLLDPVERKKAITDLNFKLGRPATQALGKIELASGAIGSALGGAATLGASIATSAVPALLVGVSMVVANAVSVGWNKKVQAEVGNMRELLKLLCVDLPALKMIEDGLEQRYYTESNIAEEIEKMFAAVLNDPSLDQEMPDFTQHLLQWINTQSEYKHSKTTIVPKGSP